MKERPNNPSAMPRRPPSAAIMAMATRRKIKAVTDRSLAPTPSIVPFHLHADAAVGIGADVALDLGVPEDLPFDHAAARLGREARAGADIDAGRHVAAALDRGGGALVVARTATRAAAAGVDRERVEA